MDNALDNGPVVEGLVGPTDELGDDLSSADPEESQVTIDAVELLLDEVEAALGRLDDGSYGRCETCGSSIEDGRLADSPTALTCVGCSAVEVG